MRCDKTVQSCRVERCKLGSKLASSSPQRLYIHDTYTIFEWTFWRKTTDGLKIVFSKLFTIQSRFDFDYTKFCWRNRIDRLVFWQGFGPRTLHGLSSSREKCYVGEVIKQSPDRERIHERIFLYLLLFERRRLSVAVMHLPFVKQELGLGHRQLVVFHLLPNDRQNMSQVRHRKITLNIHGFTAIFSACVTRFECYYYRYCHRLCHTTNFILSFVP